MNGGFLSDLGENDDAHIKCDSPESSTIHLGSRMISKWPGEKQFPGKPVFLRLVFMIICFTAGSPGVFADTQACVPLLDDGVMIRIPVKIFGQTLYFIVDTGFSISAIDTKYAPNLGTSFATVQAIGPMSSDNALPIYHAPEISVGGQSQALGRIACTDLRMARLITGEPCDGILGMDFFSKNIVTLDFDRKIFSLDSSVPEVVRNTYTAVPLKPFYEHLVAEVLISHGGVVDLMIDTGDTSSLSLNAEAWREIFSSTEGNEVSATLVGMGNEVAHCKIDLVDRLSIVGLSYTNLHATMIRNPTNPSHIGLGFFRRHVVVFDFPHRMLYLQPGRTFSRPDHEDMSGLHLLRDDQTTFVFSVDENSPAIEQGLQPGDVLLKINGQITASLPLEAIRQMLQTHPGDQVRLLVKRGGNQLAVQFALKKVI